MTEPTSDKASEPSTGLQKGFLFEEWDQVAASGLAPRTASEARSDDVQRRALLEGLRLLRLDRGPFPQQLKLVDTLSSGTRFVAILLPRQSAKTSTVEAYLIGLCATVPGLKVAYAMGTTGKAGRLNFMKNIVRPLERLYPDKEDRPFVIVKSAGQERIEWPSDSLFQVVGTPDDIRGSSFDVVWIDEAGELEGEDRAEWESAALPAQDARVGYILEQPFSIFSGTAGKSRDGNALWHYLQLGRDGDPSTAILEYSAGIDLTAEDVETWEQAEPLVKAAHPGVGTLTNLATIRGNYASLPRAKFLAEYLGVFQDAGNTSGIILPAKWRAGEIAGPGGALPTLPERVGVAFTVGYQESASSVVAAWRDEDGVAYVGVLAHQEGTQWLPETVCKMAHAHPSWKFGYDVIRAATRMEVEIMKRATFSIPLVPYRTQDAAQAVAGFMRDVNTGNLRHYGQAELDSAALSARRRELPNSGFMFGLPADGAAEISALEAAALALKTFDDLPKARRRARSTTG